MTVQTLSLSDRIRLALTDAHIATEKYGVTSTETMTAWDIVEELDAEAAHQKTKQYHTAFEDYCKEFPEAPEARMYDV